MIKLSTIVEWKQHVLDCIKNDKIIYLDLEYCFPKASRKTEWEYHDATLRIITAKIGNNPIRVIDVWREANIWHEVLEHLEEGYLMVAHYAHADTRYDVAPEAILKYIMNGQVLDTHALEKLIHGMTDPIGDYTDVGVDEEDKADVDEDVENPLLKSGAKLFALDAVVYRHTGIKLKKLYQDARNWLAKDLKPEVLKYAEEDVKYLPKIFKNQIHAVDTLDLWSILYLNTCLLGTTWINFKYGVAINAEELQKHRKECKLKAAELEDKLLQILPKVGFTDTQLIDQYFDIYWVKGVGLCGLKNKTNAIKIVKSGESHVLTSYVQKWIDEKKDTLVRTPNLAAHAQRLESFRRAGLELEDTSEQTIKNYLAENESPILESYLTWVSINSLLKKTLEKIDYGLYLRSDNTVRTVYMWVAALNGRSASRGMNVQTMPRPLKSLYGTPHGMVKIGYDYAAIELMKLLNDYPEDKLVEVLLDETQDIHILNASRFFNQDYDELLRKHKEKDPEVKKLRNAAKTVIYFLQYKTPKKPEEKFVTGTIKLQEIFRGDLGWDLSKEQAENLIITGEKILNKWTREKLSIDGDISRLANENTELESELLQHLSLNKTDLKLAMEEGIIYFRGAKGMYYKFDLLRDKIYTPEKEEIDEKTGEPKIKKEYVNSRSLYSCRIAGPVAIGAKASVFMIQKKLYEKYGPDRARLALFVHDSIDVYCDPDIADEVEELVCRIMTKTMFMVAQFSKVPVTIEGGREGNPERKVSYDGKDFHGI